MAQKPSIPKGTRDFGQREMAERNYIFDTIRSVFRTYGYQQIETAARRPSCRPRRACGTTSPSRSPAM